MNKVIAIAKQEVGYVGKQSREHLYDKTLNAGSNGFSKYFVDIFPNEFHRPYCMAFICWIYVQAYGVENSKKILYFKNGFTYICSQAANNFRKNNRWYKKTPIVGSLMFLKVQSWISHVVLITEITETKIIGISGNVLDCNHIGHVSEDCYSRNDIRIAGYGIPNYSILKNQEISKGENIIEN